MKKAIWIFLSICFLSNGFAQDSKLNLEKYWIYRERLLSDFLKMGSGKGQSIPAHHKNLIWKTASGKSKPLLNWSDGGFHLGYYLGTLSTEYFLLKKNNNDTKPVELELYYALNAVWRLDATSGDYPYDNSLWTTGSCFQSTIAWSDSLNASNWNDSSKLDGFFIRDDVNWTFKNNWAIIDSVQSSLLAPYSKRCTSKEPSQDNAIGLLIGLFLVREFVDPFVIKNGVPLRQFAINEGVRIIKALKGDGNWILRNPHLNNQEVHIGAGGWFWGFPKAAMGQDMDPNASGFHNAQSLIEKPGWNLQQHPWITPRKNRNVNLWQDAAMASMGNSWTFCSPLASLTAVVPSATCFLPLPNTTPSGLNEHAAWNSEIYFLIHKVIHGNNFNGNNTSHQVYEAILNTAPCEGPYSVWPDPGVYGWTIANRFVYPSYRYVGEWPLYKKEDFFGIGPNGSNGNTYNGLDYMLLHNLYWIRYGGDLQYDPKYTWENLVNAKIDRIFPLWKGQWLGNNTSPIEYHSIESIESTSKIGNNGDVTFKAGNEIKLKSGFRVYKGGQFRAQMDSLKCESGSWKSDPRVKEDIAFLQNYYQEASGIADRKHDSLLVALNLTDDEYEKLWNSGFEPIRDSLLKFYPRDFIMETKMNLEMRPKTGKIKILITNLVNENGSISIYDEKGGIIDESFSNLELKPGEHPFELDYDFQKYKGSTNYVVYQSQYQALAKEITVSKASSTPK
ncbi:MAG: hypothetical protein H6581_02085 [Bacteroidia bacterium]|nr:hypothetical protein [Bacteroidia bacterium]